MAASFWIVARWRIWSGGDRQINIAPRSAFFLGLM
jgi:hypothetical protein